LGGHPHPEQCNCKASFSSEHFVCPLALRDVIKRAIIVEAEISGHLGPASAKSRLQVEPGG
jgi:hypothetical protein